MASQKELVVIVATQMGIPIETVTVIDRYLAEAGLRTRALRGRGYTPMTYQDAANLIIATAWEANPKDAVQHVKDFRSLEALRVAEYAIAPNSLGQTFGDALANSIESVPEHRAEFSAHDDDPGHMSLTVTMVRQSFGVSADIVLLKDGVKNTFEYRRSYRSPEVKAPFSDLRRTAQFTQITLGFVGEAIADGMM
jgi:hypothetical protein